MPDGIKRIGTHRKMSNRWMSENDLSARLGQCFFVFNDAGEDKIVQVQVYSASKLMLCEPWTGNMIAEIKPTDDRLDVSALELGYGNIAGRDGNVVRYGIRGTNKNWKQGVCTGQVSFRDIAGNETTLFVKSPDGHGQLYILSTQGYCEALLGKYPTIDEAHQYLASRESGEIAISREVAIRQEEVGPRMVYIQMKCVGWVAPGEDVVRVRTGTMAWLVERILTKNGLSIRIEN